RGLRTVTELRGISVSSVKEEVSGRKGIVSSRSFGTITSEYRVIRDALMYHVSITAQKMRKQRSACGYMSIFVQTPKHSKRTAPKYLSASLSFSIPTVDTRDLAEKADEMLQSIFIKGAYLYGKVG